MTWSKSGYSLDQFELLDVRYPMFRTAFETICFTLSEFEAIARIFTKIGHPLQCLGNISPCLPHRIDSHSAIRPLQRFNPSTRGQAGFQKVSNEVVEFVPISCHMGYR